MSLHDKPLFRTRAAGEECPELSLSARMQVDFGLLHQEHGVLLGPSRNFDENREDLAHTIADIDEVEGRTATLHSNLKRVTLFAALADDFDLIEEPGIYAEFTQFGLQRFPLLLRG